MKTTRLSLLFLVFLLSVCLISCEDKDVDSTKPIINLIEPISGDTLIIGHEVHLEMDLSDDVMLKSYKVDIHNNFNNHSHTKTTAFNYNNSWDVSGNKNIHIHHHEIVINEDATPGNYHLMVYCTDESGNETYVARQIVIANPLDK